MMNMPPVTPQCDPQAAPPLQTPGVATRLITEPGDKENLTLNRETDCRTALTRGLSEYLSQLSIEFAGGRNIAFKRVFQTYAEYEAAAIFPSALVTSDTKGTYDMSKLTPNVPVRQVFPDGQRLLIGAEYVMDLTIDLWATDPPARAGLMAMIEDALVPVDWRYGALLELPHYFNARGTFELIDSGYVDGDLPATQRYRRAAVTVRGRVSQIRVSRYVPARLHVNTKILAPTDTLT